jgi:aerobic C4-dicarboxylate transport protein
MTSLRLYSTNLLILGLAILAGVTVGSLYPDAAKVALTLSNVYLAVINMAALPLLVVATFFGLRQIVLLPKPGKRFILIGLVACILVYCAALLGVAAGIFIEPGNGLDDASRKYLGLLVQRAGGEAQNTDLSLISSNQVEGSQVNAVSDLVPDNFFYALASGKSLDILICALVFGFAFSAISKYQSSSLNSIFEAIYRAFELIIFKINAFIPVLVFGSAAFFSATTDFRSLNAMSGFLGWFCLFVFCLFVLAISIVSKISGLSVRSVALCLKTPILVSLTSSSASASIPDTIEALSAKIGFSRGIVELITPISSVFVRSGSALYFTLLAIFVANLYGRSLSLEELFLLSVTAAVAAFASAGNNGIANIAFAGTVLQSLQLPVEAAVILFLAIDLICEGPRNLLTLMSTCVLVAVVSRGLPSEQVTSVEGTSNISRENIKFSLSLSRLLIGVSGVFLICILVAAIGVGVGLKRPANIHRLYPATVSIVPSSWLFNEVAKC